ncbi:MAG: hypothetical protein JOZ60_10805, partial [Verrucomicrobia bacterium]|nr:hypothetical protein [Verrucomicrobiota bacterium]
MLAEELDEVCDVLGRLPDEESRASTLDGAPQLVNMQMIEALAAAVRMAVRVDVRKALNLAEAALVIARKLGTDEALAFSKRAKANALWPIGECKAAVDLFNEASELFERSGNMSELGRTLSSSL